MPGVGNIIKCEGLFGAALHPLRRGTSLSTEEAISLVTCLRDFAKRWFDNCKFSKDGAGMGCALPACYGRSVCTRCRAELLLIKEGERRRLTFFCPSCQIMASMALEPEPSRHRQQLPIGLTSCACGQMPSVQLFRRPGKNFGRLHAVCSKRRHVQQPGCAGQHRDLVEMCSATVPTWSGSNIEKSAYITIYPYSNCLCPGVSCLQQESTSPCTLVCSGQKLHPHGCNFLWLDQGPQSPLKALPHCSCGQACVLRRVWLRPYQVNSADLEPVAELDPEGPRGRWRRPSAPKAEATGGSKQRRRLVQPKLGSLEVSTATVPCCRSYIDEHKK